MPLDFRNLNTLWASVLVETLVQLGVATAIVCPGSRSAPLAVAFAAHPQIEAISALDERSAAFLALGIARRTTQPALLVCTSGTAAANFYPAVVEAHESRIPLLILTADRPPELRHCNAGQAIDQQKLYGDFVNWYCELALPGTDLGLLSYLRQTVSYAWERSLTPIAGVVHLNLPFCEPLAPILQPQIASIADSFPADFFAHLAPPATSVQEFHPPTLPTSPRGIVIAGVAQPTDPESYCRAVSQIAQRLNVPVLAEGLSPLRNWTTLTPHLISTYDLILRQAEWSEKLIPDWVLRIGEMPTSKELRQWLAKTQPQQWVVDPTLQNLDPLHGQTVFLRCTPEALADRLPESSEPNYYLDLWCELEAQRRTQLDRTVSDIPDLFEGKVAWLLSQYLPPHTPLVIASSTPVRDVEWFWQPNDRHVQPFCNRGANGIDGTLSTAIGIAHHNRSTVLLTGDLALLHDTNGFLLAPKLKGHLTIVLVNNNGGGIFELLPIAQFDPPFEEWFATPQSIDFQALCAAYPVTYERISDWQTFIDRIRTLPNQGVRLLEICTDRKRDARRRQTLFAQIGTIEQV